MGEGGGRTQLLHDPSNPFWKLIFMSIGQRAAAERALPAQQEARSPKKKEGGPEMAVVVVGAAPVLLWRKFLLGRVMASGAICCVLLTRHGVNAQQFSTAQIIQCTPGGAADFEYGGVAPPPRTSPPLPQHASKTTERVSPSLHIQQH